MVNSYSSISPQLEQVSRIPQPPGAGLWNLCLQLQEDRNQIREEVEMYRCMEMERILSRSMQIARTAKNHLGEEVR